MNYKNDYNGQTAHAEASPSSLNSTDGMALYLAMTAKSFLLTSDHKQAHLSYEEVKCPQ